MAIVVEDGTGMTNSNAYASYATASAYHADRGNVAWDNADLDACEAALIRASHSLDGMYGSRLPGHQLKSSQAMLWPRYDAYNREGDYMPPAPLPAALVRATCEAALIELATPGALAPALSRGGKIKSEKIGSIATEYFDSAPSMPTYNTVSQAMNALLSKRSQLRIID